MADCKFSVGSKVVAVKLEPFDTPEVTSTLPNRKSRWLEAQGLPDPSRPIEPEGHTPCVNKLSDGLSDDDDSLDPNDIIAV